MPWAVFRRERGSCHANHKLAKYISCCKCLNPTMGNALLQNSGNHAKIMRSCDACYIEKSTCARATKQTIAIICWWRLQHDNDVDQMNSGRNFIWGGCWSHPPIKTMISNQNCAVSKKENRMKSCSRSCTNLCHEFSIQRDRIKDILAVNCSLPDL